MGMSLAKAQKMDVLTHFHFQEVRRKTTESGDTLVMFAARCMDSVSIISFMVVGKEEKIRLASLVMHRSFIDEPKLGVFARDLAKSFLAQAVPEADLPQLKTTIAEITFGGETPQPVTVGKWTAKVVTGAMTPDGLKQIDPSSIPKLPVKPTPAYAAYLGKEKQFEQNYSHCKIYIINNKGDGEGKETLQIAVDEPDKDATKSVPQGRER